MDNSSNYQLLVDRMLSLPLFMGMTQGSMNEIMTQTRLDFHKYVANEKIISAEDPCDSLLFLIKGNILMSTCSINKTYIFEEELKSPAVIEPERLFGFSQRYFSSYSTLTECSIVRILKEDVLSLASKYEIFHFNLLNIISTRSQRDRIRVWQNLPNGIVKKITSFILDHCIYPAGKKKMVITMQQLSQYLYESRLNISQTLHVLEEKKLIIMKRGIIEVPKLEQLISYKNSL